MKNFTKKIKVLHTDNSISTTGSARALLDYCKDQKEHIDSIVILPKGSSCIKAFQDADIKTYELPFIEIGKTAKKIILYFPFLLLNSWKIFKIVKKENPDILHSNDIYNLTLYVVKYLFLSKKPLVTHVRLLPSSYVKLLYPFWRKIHITFSDKLIAVSNAVKNAYGNSVKMDVIYDIGTPTEKHPEYTFHHSQGDPFRFIYIANYIPGKGQDFAIKALHSIIRQDNTSTITFAGGNFNKNNNYVNELKKLTLAFGLQDRIQFEGYIEDVELKMKQYNAALNFSESESFSFTCFDALRFGIPLIASDCGGPSELFIHNSSGILVPNKDIQNMGTAIFTLSNNPELCTKLSFNSKKYVKDTLKANGGFNELTKIILTLVKIR